MQTTAITQFFQQNPSMGKRNFYIAGLSYAGIFVPTVAERVAKLIEKGSFPNPNFKVFYFFYLLSTN